MKIQWLGHDCFRMWMGDASILIDPFLSTNPLLGSRYLFSAAEAKSFTESFLNEIDFVLISSDGLDHFNQDTVSILRDSDAIIVGSPEVVSRVNVPAERKIGIGIGETKEVCGLKITAIPANLPKATNPRGYIIQNSKTVYFAGETKFFPEIMEMRQYKIDYAILPIGGDTAFSPDEAARMAAQLNANFIIPMHYNTWPEIKQDPRKFVEICKRISPSSQVMVLKPKESVGENK